MSDSTQEISRDARCRDEDGLETSESEAVHTSWRGYWTCSDPADVAYHELFMTLSLRAIPGQMLLRGTGRHWKQDEEQQEARKKRRDECLELNPKHCRSDMDFRQRIDTALHHHTSDPVASVINGSIESGMVELSQQWMVTAVEAQLMTGRRLRPRPPNDLSMDEADDALVPVQVKYWGLLDTEAECIVGFRSQIFQPPQTRAPPSFLSSRPDHYTCTSGLSNHPWKMNAEYHPFKLVFSRPRNLHSFSRIWEGHWRFESDITEYDTTVEVSVSPEGVISGYGMGHLDSAGVSKANEFVIYGCIDQSLHFTWRKIYETRFSDYRADTQDFKQQVTYFDAMRTILLAEFKFPRDVCWSVFEFLGTELNGQWDNVESGKMGPFRLKLPVVEVPQSQSLAELMAMMDKKQEC